MYSRNVLKHALRTFFFAVFFLLSNVNESHAQFMDSIRFSLKKRPTLFGTLDTRNTFIGSRRAEISGIKGGLRFNKFRIGAGYHFLSTGSYRHFPIITNEYTGLSYVKREIKYGAVFADYVFHKGKRWEYMVAMQLGFGRSYFGPEMITGHILNDRLFVVYEPTISAEYSIFKWLGVSGKYGYRVAFGVDQMTAPIYAFGLDLYWGTIYRSTVKWLKSRKD